MEKALGCSEKGPPLAEQRRVILLGRTVAHSTGELERGIASFCGTRPQWALLDQRGVPAERWVAAAQERQVAGIICVAERVPQIEALRSLGLPMVAVTSAKLPGVSCVAIDEERVARMAAEYFLAQGFESFAHVGHPALAPTPLRREMYRRALKPYTLHVPDYPPWANYIRLTLGRSRALHAAWLKTLPRPLAVFAAYQDAAFAACDAAEEAGLRVPEDVSVLAVGDSQTCTLRSPALSVVDTSDRQRGTAAAAALEAIFERRPALRRTIVPPRGITCRGSTAGPAIADEAVSSALRYIRSHADRPLSVPEVVSCTGVSRRTLEMRFRKLVGHGIHDEIWSQHHRLAEQLLSQTQLSLSDVALRTGFGSAAVLCQSFRRRKGLTPMEFRRQNQSN